MTSKQHFTSGLDFYMPCCLKKKVKTRQVCFHRWLKQWPGAYADVGSVPGTVTAFSK